MQDDGFERGSRSVRARWELEDGSPVVGYHITMRLLYDTGIARKPAALRKASSVVLRHGEDRGLLAYSFADTHLHSVVTCDRIDAGKFALYTEAGLRKRMHIRVPFERCRIRPIGSERYLGNTLRYLFRQGEHHGTTFDRAHDGTSLPDLIGLRVGAPWLAERVVEAIPRLRLSSLAELMGVDGIDEAEPDLALIAEAAAAAFGLETLRGNGTPQHRARAAAVQVLDALAPSSDVRELLGVSARSVSRYRAEEADAAALRAVERQVRLRSLLRRMPLVR